MLAKSFNLENFKQHFQQTIPKPSRHTRVPSLSYFLSRAARVCTFHGIALSGELSRKLGKKPRQA